MLFAVFLSAVSFFMDLSMKINQKWTFSVIRGFIIVGHLAKPICSELRGLPVQCTYIIFFGPAYQEYRNLKQVWFITKKKPTLEIE